MNLAERDHKIDVLRGLAVLGVLLIHTQNAWYLGVGSDFPVENRLRLRDHWLGILSIPVTFGFLGLNLFFVLSGSPRASCFISESTGLLSRGFWSSGSCSLRSLKSPS